MDARTQCEKLADRFSQQAATGLVDVKFFLRSSDEAVAEQVCREVNRLYDSVERGEAEPLDFRDSVRKE